MGIGEVFILKGCAVELMLSKLLLTTVFEFSPSSSKKLSRVDSSLVLTLLEN